jgi:hypothetical protein
VGGSHARHLHPPMPVPIHAGVDAENIQFYKAGTISPVPLITEIAFGCLPPAKAE